MDFKENYYFEKYEQLAVLADTQKCKTILSRNTDTNEGNGQTRFGCVRQAERFG